MASRVSALRGLVRLLIVAVCTTNTQAFAPGAFVGQKTRWSSSIATKLPPPPRRNWSSSISPSLYGSRHRQESLKPRIEAYAKKTMTINTARAALDTALQSSLSSSEASDSSRPKFLATLDRRTVTAYLSAAAFCLLDVIFRRALASANISFPSSLAGCGFLFAALLALPKKVSKKVFDMLNPGAGVLAKWLPVFFVPSLVTLPLAPSMGAATELLKVGVVIVGGFFFTLLTTAWSVVAIRKVVSSNDAMPKSSGTHEMVQETQADSKDIGESVKDIAQDAVTVVTDASDTFAEERDIAPKAFSDELFYSLLALTAAGGVGSAATILLGVSSVAQPATALFLLSTTLSSFVFGARLPKRLTKIVHPLVTCTAMTWLTATAFATVTGQSFRSMLKSYRTGSLALTTTGAGDLLLFLLGPAVVSLAISMYDRRQLMRENLSEVGTAVSVSTLGGLFGTALAVRLLGIANPSLRLSLLSRNITSPLAMAIAGILGADLSLAVSMVVVTGLIGANFGAFILDAFGINDAVARGLGIGAAAHGLGTAAFVNEKDAFPFAAIGMALTASAATVAVSIPLLKRMLLQIALGW